MFAGFVMGWPICLTRHGLNNTRRRVFWNGLAAAFVIGPSLTLITYFLCPFCQPPNRDGNQAVSVEQRFKNYIDQKYHLYDDANEKFYYRMVNQSKYKESVNVMQGYEDKRRKIVEERVAA